MPLKIGFHLGDGDIHVYAFDGCKIELDPEDPNLTEIQRATANKIGLRGYFMYENAVLLQEHHFSRNSTLRLYCPDAKIIIP